MYYLMYSGNFLKSLPVQQQVIFYHSNLIDTVYDNIMSILNIMFINFKSLMNTMKSLYNKRTIYTHKKSQNMYSNNTCKTFI